MSTVERDDSGAVHPGGLPLIEVSLGKYTNSPGGVLHVVERTNYKTIVEAKMDDEDMLRILTGGCVVLGNEMGFVGARVAPRSIACRVGDVLEVDDPDDRAGPPVLSVAGAWDQLAAELKLKQHGWIAIDPWEMDPESRNWSTRVAWIGVEA